MAKKQEKGSEFFRGQGEAGKEGGETRKTIEVLEPETPWTQDLLGEEKSVIDNYEKQASLSTNSKKTVESVLTEEIYQVRNNFVKEYFASHENEIQEKGYDVKSQDLGYMYKVASEMGALNELKKDKKYKEQFERLDDLAALRMDFQSENPSWNGRWQAIGALGKRIEELSQEETGSKDEKKIKEVRAEISRLSQVRKEIAEKMTGRDLKKEAEKTIPVPSIEQVINAKNKREEKEKNERKEYVTLVTDGRLYGLNRLSRNEFLNKYYPEAKITTSGILRKRIVFIRGDSQQICKSEEELNNHIIALKVQEKQKVINEAGIEWYKMRQEQMTPEQREYEKRHDQFIKEQTETKINECDHPIIREFLSQYYPEAKITTSGMLRRRIVLDIGVLKTDFKSEEELNRFILSLREQEKQKIMDKAELDWHLSEREKDVMKKMEAELDQMSDLPEGAIRENYRKVKTEVIRKHREMLIKQEPKNAEALKALEKQFDGSGRNPAEMIEKAYNREGLELTGEWKDDREQIGDFLKEEWGLDIPEKMMDKLYRTMTTKEKQIYQNEYKKRIGFLGWLLRFVFLAFSEGVEVVSAKPETKRKTRKKAKP